MASTSWCRATCCGRSRKSKPPAIRFSRSIWVSNVAVRAELRVAGQPPKDLAARLELPYQPKSLVNYKIVIQADSKDIPADRDVAVHLSFSKHMVPQEIGFAPDPRKLVIMAPKTVVLAHEGRGWRVCFAVVAYSLKHELK